MKKIVIMNINEIQEELYTKRKITKKEIEFEVSEETAKKIEEFTKEFYDYGFTEEQEEELKQIIKLDKNINNFEDILKNGEKTDKPKIEYQKISLEDIKEKLNNKDENTKYKLYTNKIEDEIPEGKKAIVEMNFEAEVYQGMVYRYEMITDATAKLKVKLTKEEFNDLYDKIIEKSDYEQDSWKKYTEDKDTKDKKEIVKSKIKFLNEYFYDLEGDDLDEMFEKYFSWEDVLLKARKEETCNIEDTPYKEIDDIEGEVLSIKLKLY